jgi:uncharacterized membrane protein
MLTRRRDRHDRGMTHASVPETSRTDRTPKEPRRGRRAGWPAPTGLLLLAAIPLLAGAFRLTELAGGAEITPDNARFFAAPVPIVLHIVSVSLFSVLGAFQFPQRFRRRRPRWHRAAGRLLVVCGLLTALTGLWLTLFSEIPALDRGLVDVLRLVFGTAMLVSIVLGFAAIRRRDVARHRAWMIRGYAIGMGAGTQAFTHLPWMLLVGPPDKLARALLMGAGWVINLIVAEWVIRKGRSKPVGRAPRASAARHTDA